MEGDFSGFQVLGRLKAKGMLQKFNFRGAGAPKVQDQAWPQRVDPHPSSNGWGEGGATTGAWSSLGPQGGHCPQRCSLRQDKGEF